MNHDRPRWVSSFNLFFFHLLRHDDYIYYVARIHLFDAAMKVAILFALPALFGLWLGLGVAGSVLVGLGYGFFTPWVSTFEAFRHDNESKKFLHSFVVMFCLKFEYLIFSILFL